MTIIDLYDLSPQVCPSCHDDLGPHGCDCGRPSAHLDPDDAHDERGRPSQGWSAVYAGPPQGMAAYYTGGAR